MSSIKGKHILITGGASGIGFLMGRQALNHGAQKLIIWDIDEQRLSEATDKLPSNSGQVHTYNVDVSDPDQVYQTASNVLEKHSRVDILINNAGVVTGKNFTQHSREDIENTIGVNLLAAMHTTRAFLPSMIDRQSGHIVNIASAAGLMANPNMSVYASSKWGMIGWSESLRIELNQQNAGIPVTTIEPSYINTGMFDGVKPPLLTPFLDANDIAGRIINAIEQNKIHLRAPFMVKLIPFLKGILPTKVFDFVAGRLFQVYHSMDTFKGRTSEIDNQ
jgi:short-subunit dehydrogenase